MNTNTQRVTTTTVAQSSLVQSITAQVLESIAPSIAEIVAAAVVANVAVQPEAGTVKAAPPVAANGKPIVFRSAPGKAAAKAACAELAVKYDLKVAGGSRTFKSLSAKEQAAYRAESKAIWAAVPVTRTTKA